MNILWIGVSLAVVAGLAKRFVRRRDPDGQSGLGSVTQQWLAEHRLAHTNDTHR